MSRSIRVSIVVAFAFAAAGACSGKSSETGDTTGQASCQGGGCADGVGDSCTPSDESNADFPGFGVNEINIEDRTTQCATGLCIAVNFQGRLNCPYGGSDCTTESGAPVSVPVKPQLLARSPSDAVYCSCRCDGPGGTGPFCACPDGFECAQILPAAILPVAQNALVGSYCIKQGTRVSDPAALASGSTCNAALHNCDDR